MAVSKCKIGVYVFLVVVACIEVIVLPALTIVWRQNRITLPTPKQQTLCYPWGKFISDSVEVNCPSGSNMTTIKNSTFCCGTSSSVFDLLVTKVVSDRYDSETNPELSSLDLKIFSCDVVKERISATKLVGISQRKQPVIVDTASKVFWNSRSPSYFTSSLKYEHKFGTIHVKKPGLYFVTSQLRYKLTNNKGAYDETDDVKKNTFRHFVNLISNDTSSVLLEDAKFKCDIASAESAITSSVGAVFRLNEGEKLYVATSHPEFLVTADQGSFISMHLLEK